VLQSGASGSDAPPELMALPPGTAPGASEEALARKRRHGGVEGLASNKHIRSGGTVTVYNGYSAATATPASKAQQTGEAVQQAAPAQASVVAAAAALPRQLPEGWEMKRSRTTGRVYYVNEKLGTSQFDPPAGSTVKAEPAKKKISKASSRAKDGPDAQVTDQNGVKGLVRATDAKTGRWQKWQKCNRILNAPEPENEL